MSEKRSTYVKVTPANNFRLCHSVYVCVLCVCERETGRVSVCLRQTHNTNHKKGGTYKRPQLDILALAFDSFANSVNIGSNKASAP